MITDKQLQETTDAFRSNVFSDPYNKMRHAIESYEQSKWTKFDVEDSSTWPTSRKVFVKYKGTILTGCWIFRDDDADIFSDAVSHWQLIPQFEES
jgi:hypothetical protein